MQPKKLISNKMLKLGLWQQEFKRPFNIGLSDKLGGEEYCRFGRNKRLFEMVVSIFQEKGWRLYIRTDSNVSQILLLDEIVPGPQSPYRGYVVKELDQWEANFMLGWRPQK